MKEKIQFRLNSQLSECHQSLTGGGLLDGDLYCTIVGDGVYIGKGTELRESIVGHDAYVGSDVKIPDGGVRVPSDGKVPDGADLRNPEVRKMYDVSLMDV